MGTWNEQEITAFDEAEADSHRLNWTPLALLPQPQKNLPEQKMSEHFKAPMCHLPLATSG